MRSALLLGGAVGLMVRKHRFRWSAGSIVGVLQPVLAAGGGACWGLLLVHRRLRARRVTRAAAAADVAVLAELVGLGLSAGLTLGQTLSAARTYVHPQLQREVGGVLRQAKHGGLARALAETEGYGRRLYVVSARAVVTGAPLVAAVDGFSRELTAEQHAGQLVAARRLPVKLMVPLALFILPGFVLLTVGPTVIAALQRVVLPH